MDRSVKASEETPDTSQQNMKELTVTGLFLCFRTTKEHGPGVKALTQLELWYN